MLGRLTRLSFSGPAFLANANFRCVSVSKSPRFLFRKFSMGPRPWQCFIIPRKKQPMQLPELIFLNSDLKKVSNSKWVPSPLFLVGKTLIKLIHSWGFSRHLCWVSQKCCVFFHCMYFCGGEGEEAWRIMVFDIRKVPSWGLPFTSTHWDVFFAMGGTIIKGILAAPPKATPPQE